VKEGAICRILAEALQEEKDKTILLSAELKQLLKFKIVING
jgi:hypothetical protein